MRSWHLFDDMTPAESVGRLPGRAAALAELTAGLADPTHRPVVARLVVTWIPLDAGGGVCDTARVVLAELTRRLRAVTGRRDLLTGDDAGGFLFVCPASCPSPGGLRLGERFRPVFRDPVSVGDRWVRVTGRVGVATATPTDTPISLLDRAGTALVHTGPPPLPVLPPPAPG